MTEQSLQEARGRAARYDYEDGTIEIGHGAVYAVLGVLLWLFDAMSTGGQYKWLYAVGVLAFSFVSAAVVGSLVSRYKQRITYPRTGRVHYERPASAEAWDAILLIGASLLVAGGAIFIEGRYTGVGAIVGATIALLLFFAGRRALLARMQWIALLPLLIGLVSAYLGIDDTFASALIMAGAGLALLLSGILAMRSYLAANPDPTEEA